MPVPRLPSAVHRDPDRAEREYRRWFRPSPLFGLLGGLMLAGFTHLGVSPDPVTDGVVWFLLTRVANERLFATAPLVGYALFATVGLVFGWVSRRVWDHLWEA